MKTGVLASIVFALLIGLPITAMAGLAPDTDGDGVPDVIDNCSLVPNAAPANCDTDVDGYGNACDGDFNQSFVVDATDFSSFFLPDFSAGMDNSGTGTDMNCSTVVDATDFGSFFLPQFTGGAPGPSGLGCAGTPGCM
jgi:hypothetical protein